ncbi:hypothetical protein ACOSQ4_004924 [Xanthoceras sorbifolium]
MPLKYERLLGHPLRECMEQQGAISAAGDESLRFEGWLRAGSPPRLVSKAFSSKDVTFSREQLISDGASSDGGTLPSTATQNSFQQNEHVEGASKQPKGDRVAVVNPVVAKLYVFHSPALNKGTNSEPFISNSVLDAVDLGGAPLVFKGSGISSGESLVSRDGWGSSDGVLLGCGNEEVRDTKKRGWKRWAQSSMVVMDDVQDSVQLGKCETVGDEDGRTRGGGNLGSVVSNIKSVSLALSHWYSQHRATLRADNKRLQEKLEVMTAYDDIASWAEFVKWRLSLILFWRLMRSTGVRGHELNGCEAKIVIHDSFTLEHRAIGCATQFRGCFTRRVIGSLIGGR